MEVLDLNRIRRQETETAEDYETAEEHQTAKPSPAKVLVLANRTADSAELLDALRDRAGQGPVEFFLIAPATPSGLTWATNMYAARDEARRRAETALRRFKMAGLTVADARVGDPDPIAAVARAAATESFDEIFVSTLPRPLSSWLNFSLPQRLELLVGAPVTHVTARTSRRPRAVALAARRKATELTPAA